VAVRGVRGATQLEEDEREHLVERVAELVRAMLAANGLDEDQLISILFTATPDLTCEFPAYAARTVGLRDVPLICSTEMAVPGALARTVRVLMHVESPRPRAEIQHVFLHGAAVLRPDLASGRA
jgi:chorismate mutase